MTEQKKKEPKEAKNVDMSMEGDIMVIKVDTTKTFGMSKSGKTTIVGTTSGEQLMNGVCVNLNIYKR